MYADLAREKKCYPTNQKKKILNAESKVEIEFVFIAKIEQLTKLNLSSLLSEETSRRTWDQTCYFLNFFLDDIRTIVWKNCACANEMHRTQKIGTSK